MYPQRVYSESSSLTFLSMADLHEVTFQNLKIEKILVSSYFSCVHACNMLVNLVFFLCTHVCESDMTGC